MQWFETVADRAPKAIQHSGESLFLTLTGICCPFGPVFVSFKEIDT